MSIGRNELCACGSGKKYKHCCLLRPQAAVPGSRAGDGVQQRLQEALAHAQAGRLAACEAVCQALLRDVPEQVDALYLLSVVAQQAGQPAQALALLDRALARIAVPQAAMLLNRGVVLQSLRRLPEAAESYRRALTLAPGLAAAHAGLAHACKHMGQLAAAVAAAQAALRLEPQMREAQFTLGTSLFALNRYEEAEAVFRRALQGFPQSPEFWQQLGDVLQRLGRLIEAEGCYQRSLSLKPDAAPWNNLGQVLVAQGRIDAALAAFGQALRLNPQDASAHSNRLLAMQYSSELSPEQVYAAHREFAACIEAPLKGLWQPHDNAPQPDRRLNIAYLSGDLCQHVVASFIEPVLAWHDKSHFRIFCYHNHREDEVSERLKGLVDGWRNCAALDDAELAARIRADGIDILVDLSGHTALNRLPVLARKPAPVQVTWLGYPGTTGLDAVDYRLSDRFLDPEGMADAYYREKIVHLPSCVTFRPSPESPDVNTLPALAAGFVTLACLNNLTKINAAVIRVWAQILAALPASRLILANVNEAAVGERLLRQFAEAGVDSARILLKPRLALREFLALHHDIDIALDPFPYGGGTTTNHALWMGVPVVTLAGRSSASRQGATLLANAGMADLVTWSEDDYVRRVVQLAGDLPALNLLRQRLRAQSGEQAGAGAEAVTRSLEEAYRHMWRHWCDASEQSRSPAESGAGAG